MTSMNGTSTAAAVDYGPHEAAMQAYLREGKQRAMALGNRGPIRLDAGGALHPDILAAFSRCGFSSGERHVWNAEAKAGLRDYNLLDLSI